ncbi:YczE/YyaS/YitT family protein [Streptococcus hyovaginalis]
MNSKTIHLNQIIIYMIGIVIVSLGITFNTKTALGVSPVISLAFNAAKIFHVSIGLATFLYYVFLIAIQFLLLRKNFQRVQLLQVFASFLTSFFIQGFDYLLPVPQSLLTRLIWLVIGIVLTGLGASITVNMKLIPNPADALADTIGFVLNKSFGFGKNVLDFTCTFLALALSFCFGQGMLGVGIGTIIAMIFTGRVVALCNPFSEKLYNRYVLKSQQIIG